MSVSVYHVKMEVPATTLLMDTSAVVLQATLEYFAKQVITSLHYLIVILTGINKYTNNLTSRNAFEV